MSRFVPANSFRGRQMVNIRGSYNSKHEPHDGEKQCAKKWNNHTSRTGHVTIGKAPSRYY